MEPTRPVHLQKNQSRVYSRQNHVRKYYWKELAVLRRSHVISLAIDRSVHLMIWLRKRLDAVPFAIAAFPAKSSIAPFASGKSPRSAGLPPPLSSSFLVERSLNLPDFPFEFSFSWQSENESSENLWISDESPKYCARLAMFTFAIAIRSFEPQERKDSRIYRK